MDEVCAEAKFFRGVEIWKAVCCFIGEVDDGVRVELSCSGL